MAKRTYEAKPGTVAFRVIAHLETFEKGAERPTALIAESLGVPPNNLAPCMQAALDAGVVFRRQKDHSHPRSPFFWSLVNHDAHRPVTPPPGPQEPMGSASPPVAPTLAPPPTARRASALGSSGRSTCPTNGSKPRIALWNDGLLQFHRANGELVEFNGEETTALVKYLDRLGAQ